LARAATIGNQLVNATATIFTDHAAVEHDPEKWTPVFGQDHAQMKNLDPDPIQ
jgi:hypothetical protein